MAYYPVITTKDNRQSSTRNYLAYATSRGEYSRDNAALETKVTRLCSLVPTTGIEPASLMTKVCFARLSYIDVSGGKET